MGQSLSQIYLHIVFSTRERKPILRNEEIRKALHAYLAGTCRQQDSPSIIVGGTEDHVHILCQLAKTIAVAGLVRELKRDSSKWLKEQSRELQTFQWQRGYGAFSVSPSHLDGLKEYIRNQEEHHRTESFQEEFLRLLRKYGVEFEERYLWE